MSKRPVGTPTVCHQMKLILRPAQERVLDRWLWHLTGVYNWASRKIDLDSSNRIYWSSYDLEAMLKGHSARLGVPHTAIVRVVRTAHNAWQRRFKNLSGKPKLKGRRNRLISIPFDADLRPLGNHRVYVPHLKSIRFHAQWLPEGHWSSARIIKRASGWYLCVFIQAEPNRIPVLGDAEVGIDPGFSSLLTLSDGTVVAHPRELEALSKRLSQAQRGRRTKLAARIHERIGNQRRDRNHKLSRGLVAHHDLIAFSADDHSRIATRFGKSVTSSSHYQLRQMLAYKSRLGGRRYVEVPSRNSTRTCSACGALTGPTGYAGLSVRAWECGCGAEHDRDVNAALNTLRLGRGLRLECGGNVASGIATKARRRRSTETLVPLGEAL